ncbi:hypothetical protein PoB_005402700 [Plakobranchus ocellatus]|uniref:Uncharacterized protein n=1 Tax=Plakobranchus ocellatus TaxID=259542 RepID=A0AAV4C7M0_9GAST|nr:hypothetical protein PoB_005402700 [Plakobranchus ocellatus]
MQNNFSRPFPPSISRRRVDLENTHSDIQTERFGVAANPRAYPCLNSTATASLINRAPILPFQSSMKCPIYLVKTNASGQVIHSPGIESHQEPSPPLYYARVQRSNFGVDNPLEIQTCAVEDTLQQTARTTDKMATRQLAADVAWPLCSSGGISDTFAQPCPVLQELLTVLKLCVGKFVLKIAVASVL